jgi:DNA gyrase subunit A
MSLRTIIRSFLDFRLEKTRMRLQHRLETLEKRIHILQGFEAIFQDLDLALQIIRSAKSRKEAEEGLRSAFKLDDEQVEAVLETRLYRLMAMEMARLVDELVQKKRDAARIRKDLASESRLWKIVDKDLEDLVKKFGDQRLTAIVTEQEATAIEYDPEEFVEHERVTVILSRQGWIRRIKSDIDQISSLKFREGDELLDLARISTDSTIGLFTNLGKLYVIRGLDVPQSTGFGEPLDNLFTLADGESVVGMIAPSAIREACPAQSRVIEEEEDTQQNLFNNDFIKGDPKEGQEPAKRGRSLIVTVMGQGFRFDHEPLMEPTKRIGRKFVNLKNNDRVLGVCKEKTFIALVSTDSRILAYPSSQISILAGPALGVRLIKLPEGTELSSFHSLGSEEKIELIPKRGKSKTLQVEDLPFANRGTRGKILLKGLKELRSIDDGEAG